MTTLAARSDALPLPEAEMTTGTQRAGMAAAGAGARGAAVQQLLDYVTLTKPRIISLLLVTTVVPMAMAAGGWPGGGAVLLAVLGGYLMAGGANAMNMFVDRDIDGRMARTALRPIPSGRMSPGHVLAFSATLAAVAFAIFAIGFNLLSAVLALCGLLYYVGIYTLWLKRRTPHNIVIGGGAGAFPPLVGWAAVTGEISLVGVSLFLVVVLWTPPHFWALALVKQKDYGNVGVPMAPNVWGEDRTLRQMAWYAVALVAVTLAPAALGAAGPLYAVAALALGFWLLRDLSVLCRAVSRTAPAWALYRTSLLYLALLFVALGVDVAVR
jgi:heme o synthase